MENLGKLIETKKAPVFLRRAIAVAMLFPAGTFLVILIMGIADGRASIQKDGAFIFIMAFLCISIIGTSVITLKNSNLFFSEYENGLIIKQWFKTIYLYKNNIESVSRVPLSKMLKVSKKDETSVYLTPEPYFKKELFDFFKSNQIEIEEGM